MRSLYEINQAYLELFNKFDPETGEVLFTDKELDDIKEEFEVKADNIACIIKDKNALIEARKVEMDSLKEKNEKEKRQVEHLTKYLLNAMQLRDSKKLVTVRNIISTRNSKSVQIESELLIPKIYMKVKTESSPMKKEIGDALKKGIEVPGCKLLENTSLAIK